MRLADLVNERLIDASLAASNKEEAITKLVDLLVAGGRIPAAVRPAALKAVLDRERSLSTGMEHGVAIPHGSIDDLDDMACAFGISPAGVDFASLDGAPARLILLLVIPRKKFSR